MLLEFLNEKVKEQFLQNRNQIDLLLIQSQCASTKYLQQVGN